MFENIKKKKEEYAAIVKELAFEDILKITNIEPCDEFPEGFYDEPSEAERIDMLYGDYDYPDEEEEEDELDELEETENLLACQLLFGRC
jgi:hypothetical protein